MASRVMSEATVQALATTIYDALDESGILRELDNEQVWAVAELAAQTIDAAGTTKAIVRAWLTEQGMTSDLLTELAAILGDVARLGEQRKAFGAVAGAVAAEQDLTRWATAIRAVSS
jgi:hypothetical protein